MNRRKSITLAILVVLLLTFAVSGTIAYITTKTDPVENVFTPAKPGVDVTDKVENNAKKNVDITNTSDFKAYIRVAVVANWCNANGEIVEPWSDTLAIKGGWDGDTTDGYYYYTTPVNPNQTVRLFDSYQAPTRTDGAHLEMNIIAQSIQAEPTDAVKQAWGVTVNGTTISK